MLLCAAFLSALLAPTVIAVPTRRSTPTVTLDSATFTGLASGGVNKFLGIPYAQPPIGDLRFRLPQPIPPYAVSDSQSATSFGFSCPQQTSNNTPNITSLPPATIEILLGTVSSTMTPSNESCLTLNVITPANATPTSKLPVVIHDSLSTFGFLPGKEVKAAGVGNIGLQDQREGMRWVQKYISQFGGDPTKVTIWGDSAGSISVGLHTVANNGNNEGLFRGAFMESGSPIPTGDIADGQPYFDALVAETGCSAAADKLACLRTVPYANLTAAMNASPGSYSYQSLKLAWVPRVDGVFLTQNPQLLIAEGKVANVAMVAGDCDDEGTLFSLAMLNITTTAQLKQYLQSVWFPQASSAAVNEILNLYPDNPVMGSPFGTGTNNSLSAQFKRISALEGDLVFQAPRRYFLQQRSSKQKTWSYHGLGSVHGADSVEIYTAGPLADYLINFVANLDPNGSTNIPWPRYTPLAPNLLTLYDNPDLLNITQDTFRLAPIKYLIDLSLLHPIF
ncbi:hypothetical protein HWV62_12434 [Athelia sp. TMB]|nr:hypothetical protein HWV62_12434 [Athelia sp. TMB]